MLRRTVNNQLAEAKGKLDAFGDTLLGLWNVVVDAGDIASTALPTSYLVDAIYEGVTGEERPSLLERNDLARGAVETATNAVNYVGDTVTGNKSWEQIKSDAKSVGQGLYDDYIDPFVKDAQYDQDNLLKGGLWTRSEEQSYEKGQNEFKKDMVVAEVAVSALSAGTGTAAMRTVKLANKLDGPGGPKGLGGGRKKGIGGLLFGTVDDMMDGGASVLDGKMKTSAKTLGDKQAEIQALVEKFQLKMKEQSNKEVDNRLDGGKGHDIEGTGDLRQISSGGLRNEIELTSAQRNELVDYAKKLGFPEENIVFRDSWNTGMMYDRLYINTDVLPAKSPGVGTLNANSRVSGKATIAHEIIGHYEAYVNGKAFNLYDVDPATFARNFALDEAQASIRAARFAPDLTSTERMTLLRDAITRLKNGGLRIRDVKDELFIQNR